MKLRALISIMLLLAVILTACSDDKTGLRFENATECGTASIRILNVETGNVKELTVEEGEEKEIELDADIEYNYTVEYPRQADYLQCDKKEVITLLSKGQMLNVRLESVRDPALDSTDEAE